MERSLEKQLLQDLKINTSNLSINASVILRYSYGSAQGYQQPQQQPAAGAAPPAQQAAGYGQTPPAAYNQVSSP